MSAQDKTRRFDRSYHEERDKALMRLFEPEAMAGRTVTGNAKYVWKNWETLMKGYPKLAAVSILAALERRGVDRWKVSAESKLLAG